MIDPIDLDSTFQPTNPLTISWVSFPLVIETISNLIIFDFVECHIGINLSKVQTIENLLSNGQQNLNTKYILNLRKLFKIVLDLKCFLWMRINSSFELYKLVNTPKLKALPIIKHYVVNLV